MAELTDSPDDAATSACCALEQKTDCCKPSGQADCDPAINRVRKPS